MLSSSQSSLNSDTAFEEAELKAAIEKAETYDERSRLRAQLRQLKKFKGDSSLTSSKLLSYTRAGHQIQPSNFKSDSPSYYQPSAGVGNRHKETVKNSPKPKHWIPGMMSPVSNRKLEGPPKATIKVPNISSERSQSCNTELEVPKGAVERSSSHDINLNLDNGTYSETSESELSASQVINENVEQYNFDENSGNQDFSNLNIDIQQREDPIGGETSPTANDNEEISDNSEDKTPNEIQESGQHDEQPQQQTIETSESYERLEEEVNHDKIKSSRIADKQISIESKIRSEQTDTSRHRKDTPYKADPYDNTGELDLLHQQQSNAETEEERAQIMQQIKDLKRSKYRRHSSHIQIDVKKNQSSSDQDYGTSSTSSPPQSPPDSSKHVRHETGIISESPETEEITPEDVTDTNAMYMTEKYTSTTDKKRNQTPEEGFVDLAQVGDTLSGSSITGKDPQSWGKNQIDFTTVLHKSNSPVTEYSKKRSPAEQRNFKDVLKKADKPQTSPPSRKIGLDQQDFRHLLKNRVKTNDHKTGNKVKIPPKPMQKTPSPKTAPDYDSNENTSPAPEYEYSLPNSMVFNSDKEPHLEMERDSQLDEPNLEQESPKVSPSRLNEPEEQKSNVSSVSLEDETFNTTTNEVEIELQKEAELAYRRQSLELRQHSRKKHQEFQRKSSLSKIRMSLNEDKPSPDSPIAEEADNTSVLQKSDHTHSEDTFLNHTEVVSSLPTEDYSYRKENAPQNEDSNQIKTENVLSSYEARREARKKQRTIKDQEPEPSEERLAAPTSSRSRTTRNNPDKNPNQLTPRDRYMQNNGISPEPITRIHSPKASPNSASSRVLSWVRRQTAEYNIEIKDLSTSWKNGLAFCALIHSYVPEKLDFDSLNPENAQHNLELAFDIARECGGVEKLIDPEDIIEMDVPDTKSIMTYLSSIHEAFS